jgi:3-mercaptopyruvate sulfurtransferase SseA
MRSRIDLQRLVLASMSVLLTIGVLWFTNQAVIPREAKRVDVQAQAENGGYSLISTEDLRRLFEKEPRAILLVDTRQEWEYETGHIPGSINFPMEPTWWSRWRNKGPLESVLGADKDRCIVFY